VVHSPLLLLLLLLLVGLPTPQGLLLVALWELQCWRPSLAPGTRLRSFTCTTHTTNRRRQVDCSSTTAISSLLHLAF